MSSERVLIHGFAFGGRAVGKRADGKVCFVRGAIPGETVEAEIVSERKNYSEGILEKVLEPSPFRMVSECPNPCPGCSYSHVPYSMELEWKQRQFRTFAEKAKLRSKPDDFLRPPVGAPCRLQWRNKLKLALEFSGNDVRAGYRGEDNRTLIEVRDCPLACAPIREVLRSGRWKESLPPGEESLLLRHTAADGVRIVKKGEKAILTEELSSFGKFRVPSDSFFQVNPSLSGVLAGKAAELVSVCRPERMVELYCGCGCFSILCAEREKELRCFGVELDARSVNCAKENASAHGVGTRCEFVAGDAGKTFRRRYPHGLPPNTLLLVDPPRTGLDHGALDLLRRSRADFILYVSCAPDTLFRDLAELEKASCSISESTLVDMFPSTAHFESVTLLKRTV